MTKETFTAFDPAKYLDSPEAIAAFLADSLESNNATCITNAPGVAARAKGMSALALDAWLSREHLYHALSDGGNPTLKTLLCLMRAFGVQLTARPEVTHH